MISLARKCEIEDLRCEIDLLEAAQHYLNWASDRCITAGNLERAYHYDELYDKAGDKLGPLRDRLAAIDDDEAMREGAWDAEYARWQTGT